MIYLLISFAIGVGGGAGQIKGDDIVAPSYGPTIDVFLNMEMAPGLVYSINLGFSKCQASTRSMFYDSLGNVYSRVLGEDFESFQGNLSLEWYPFESFLKPYFSARIGVMRWRFTENGNTTKALNGIEFDRKSLSLGGGLGLSKDFSDFIVATEIMADFIFSADTDWEEGLGPVDDNEYTTNVKIKILRRF